MYKSLQPRILTAHQMRGKKPRLQKKGDDLFIATLEALCYLPSIRGNLSLVVIQLKHESLFCDYWWWVSRN